MKSNLQFLSILIVSIIIVACGGQNKSSKAKDSENNNILNDSRDGKSYKTVKIGSQMWMAENLAYKEIDNCWSYNNDQNLVSEYGYLYNWEAAKQACPEGWHLPSEAEWKILIDFLGGYDVAGGKLKTTNGWHEPNIGASNSCGFAALPSGSLGAEFYGIDYATTFWSSSEISTTNAWCLTITSNGSDINMYEGYKTGGFSVRCIKD